MSDVFKERKKEINLFKDALLDYKLKKTVESTKKNTIPDDTFYVCPECGHSFLKKSFEQNGNVCPFCNKHAYISSRKMFDYLCDSNSVQYLFEDIELSKFKFPGYKEKIENYQEKTKLKDAVVCASVKISKKRVAMAVMDNAFMMASMGSVVGEKITKLVKYANVNNLPLIIFASSGGARMQEGIISLMQMVKTSQEIAKFKEKGLYISVLTNPTTGGVSASFASLGDITLAYPKALIGFAGKRVIEKTINEKLPDNFQTAEFCLEYGHIDAIVKRNEMKEYLSKILEIHGVKDEK